MKIVCLLGTHTQEFKRMAKALDEYAYSSTDDEFIVQTGYTNYIFENITHYFNFCSKEKMQQLINDADLLILQGGWGGICEAVDKKKKVIVIPRINGPEHIHDQSQVVRKMEQLGCVIGVYVTLEGESLPENIFKNNKCLDTYSHKTAILLKDAINKAKYYEFKPLKRGNSNIISEALKNWFKH